MLSFVTDRAGAQPASRPPTLITIDGQTVKWGGPTPGHGATITFAIVDRERDFPQARNCRRIGPLGELLRRSGLSDADFTASLADAMAAWSAAARIDFVEAAEPAQAQILIGTFLSGPGEQATGIAYADISAPQPSAGSMRSIESARICLSPDRPWSVTGASDAGRPNLVYVLLHELGHALGLDHNGRSRGIMGFAYQPQLADRGLGPGDQAGVAFLYGPPPEHPGKDDPLAPSWDERAATRPSGSNSLAITAP